jgi:hypothetical protein
MPLRVYAIQALHAPKGCGSGPARPTSPRARGAGWQPGAEALSTSPAPHWPEAQFPQCWPSPGGVRITNGPEVTPLGSSYVVVVRWVAPARARSLFTTTASAFWGMIDCSLWPPRGMVPVPVGCAASSLLDLGRRSECALSARIALERCPSLELVWSLDCCRIFRNSACIAAPSDSDVRRPSRRRSRTTVLSGLLGV